MKTVIVKRGKVVLSVVKPSFCEHPYDGKSENRLFWYVLNLRLPFRFLPEKF